MAFLNARTVSEREEALRLAVRGLPDAQRKRFHERAGGLLRDPDTYAVLNYLFIAGLHHFYLGKWLRGTINLAIFSAGVWLVFHDQARAGLWLIAAIILAELYALFRPGVIVQDHNNRVTERLLRELGAATDTDP